MLSHPVSSKTSDKIEHRSIASEAAEIIRNKVVTGIFPQGSRITEEEIATSLGVSRVCIREALVSLESEGIIKRVRNKYTQVVQFSVHDIKEIYSLRIVLESLCAEVCIENNTAPIPELEKQVEAMETSRMQKPLDATSYMNADLGFHELIVVGSGHSRAYRAWGSIRSQIEMLLFPILVKKPDSMIAEQNRHSDIIAALDAKNVDVAKHVIANHLLNGERQLLLI